MCGINCPTKGDLVYHERQYGQGRTRNGLENIDTWDMGKELEPDQITLPELSARMSDQHPPMIIFRLPSRASSPLAWRHCPWPMYSCLLCILKLSSLLSLSVSLVEGQTEHGMTIYPNPFRLDIV